MLSACFSACRGIRIYYKMSKKPGENVENVRKIIWKIEKTDIFIV